jgi:hypothetical protein
MAEAEFGSLFVALEGEGDRLFGREEPAEVCISCDGGLFIFPNCGICDEATAAAIANQGESRGCAASSFIIRHEKYECT